MSKEGLNAGRPGNHHQVHPAHRGHPPLLSALSNGDPILRVSWPKKKGMKNMFEKNFVNSLLWQ